MVSIPLYPPSTISINTCRILESQQVAISSGVWKLSEAVSNLLYPLPPYSSIQALSIKKSSDSNFWCYLDTFYGWNPSLSTPFHYVYQYRFYTLEIHQIAISGGIWTLLWVVCTPPIHPSTMTNKTGPIY